jgi:Tat protein translocase TatB subunit
VFNVGPGELFAIFALALIVLGPDRLPAALRTGGRVVGELRRVVAGFQDELRSAVDDTRDATVDDPEVTEPGRAPSEGGPMARP